MNYISIYIRITLYMYISQIMYQHLIYKCEVKVKELYVLLVT